MEIQHSKAGDIPKIFELYSIATAYQKEKGAVQWPTFDRHLVETEIKELRQFKMVIEGEIACVWAITESDPEIWEERNDEPAIYIHRISTNPQFRGRNLVNDIVTWSRDVAKRRHRKYVRMDTVGENKGLINYYKKCGFDFLGLSVLKNTDGLPDHYDNATVSLFQMTV